MTTFSTLRRVSSRPLFLLWGCLLLVTVAELLTSLVSAQLGLLAHALLLVGLTLYGALGQLDESR